MIAEDEAIERKALRFIINKYYTKKIQIICEVTNGRQAIDKALELRPDIIIADINMPNVDGLKASEEIKLQLPNTELIILTAFGYFEYAKKAISVGASDYLLKPISNEELCSALDKVMDKIEGRREKLAKEKELKGNINKLTPFLEKEMIMKLILENGLEESQFNEYRKLLNINSEAFTCIVFKSEGNHQFDYQVLDIIKSKFKFAGLGVIGHPCLKELVFLIFHRDIQKYMEGNNITNIIREARCLIQDRYNLHLYYGLGRVYESISKLNNSYSEAKLAIENQMKVKNPRNTSSDDLMNYIYNRETIMCGKIINEDIQGAFDEFQSILGYLMRNKSKWDHLFIGKYMKELYLITNRSVANFFGNTFESLNIEALEKELGELNEIEEISNHFKNFLKEMVAVISEYKRDRNTKVIESIKDYVRENYMQDISLVEVAEFISLSPYYLSKLFKRVEGENFKDYLIKIRMQRAKHLLREEGKSIKETAIEVGYSDPNYFSRAFKKYVGVSATEFIR